MRPIVLLTDFGIKDGHVGVMKGVILCIAPSAQIIDLSHGIQPQNISEAALILWRAYRYFPEGTIFVAVVDPVVGTARRPIAAQVGSYIFVLPDNGIITPILDEARAHLRSVQIVHLQNQKYWNDTISYTFHGRDIFAPVGAHLANGVDILKLGDLIENPKRLEQKQPVATKGKLLGEIIHIDHFGNITTNIRKEHLKSTKTILVRYKNVEISGLYNTFGDAEIGSLIALLGSTDSLLIGRVNGNAAAYLSAEYGEPIEVTRLD